IVLVGAMAFGGLRFGSAYVVVAGLVIVETFLLAMAALWSGVLRGTLQFGTLGFGQFVEAFVKVIFGTALAVLGLSVTGAILGIVAGTAVYLVIIGWRTRKFTFWRERTWGGRAVY